MLFVKLTSKEQEEEINKASLGVTQIFLGNVVRLNEHRFTKYYCNKETFVLQQIILRKYK